MFNPPSTAPFMAAKTLLPTVDLTNPRSKKQVNGLYSTPFFSAKSSILTYSPVASVTRLKSLDHEHLGSLKFLALYSASSLARSLLAQRSPVA